jgi:hypothetical protein
VPVCQPCTCLEENPPLTRAKGKARVLPLKPDCEDDPLPVSSLATLIYCHLLTLHLNSTHASPATSKSHRNFTAIHPGNFLACTMVPRSDWMVVLSILCLLWPVWLLTPNRSLSSSLHEPPLTQDSITHWCTSSLHSILVAFYPLPIACRLSPFHLPPIARRPLHVACHPSLSTHCLSPVAFHSSHIACSQSHIAHYFLGQSCACIFYYRCSSLVST